MADRKIEQESGRKIRRDSFLWNLLSAGMNSFQTMLLLVVLTRAGTDADAAAFVMAYAAGNLLYNIGKYGVRQFQVTDVREEYSFADYFRARIVSVGLMAVAVLLFTVTGLTGRGYTPAKAGVVALICVYKGIEAFEDVFHGRMQQLGRLDTAGKILFTRILSFVLCFAALFLLTKNLLLTAAVSTALAGALAVVLNRAAWPEFRDQKEGMSLGWKRLLKTCLPLCVSMLLNMYLGNAPKYIIDGRVTDAVQARFNIVYMPVFVLVLLGTFLYQPELKGIGEAVKGRKTGELKRRIGKLTGITLGGTLLAMAGGAVLGIPVLQLIYKTDLSDLRFELVLFILCGGLIALTNLYGMALIAYRKQTTLTAVYLFSSAVIFLAGPAALASGGVRALTILFAAVLAVHAGLLAGGVLRELNRKRVYDHVCLNGYFTSEKMNGVPRCAMETVKRLDAFFAPGAAELVVPKDAKNIPALKNIHVTTWEERGSRKETGGPLWGTLVYGPYVRKKKALNVNLTNRAEWVPGSLTALYDTISLRRDAYDLDIPPEDLKKIQKTQRINRWWFLFKIFVKRHTAETVVTCSEASRKEFTEHQGFEKDRVKVIGCGWEHVREQEQKNETTDERIQPGNYYFFIGNLYPHKNLKWILGEAKQMPDSLFVIAGKMPYAMAEGITAETPNVIFTGYISDACMAWLMANTKALLFPSKAEGFGIPPLEALALGRPAIVSDIPVLKEIYGDAVHFIDPCAGPVDLEQVLAEETGDPGKVLEKYTWDRAARQWVELIAPYLLPEAKGKGEEA